MELYVVFRTDKLSKNFALPVNVLLIETSLLSFSIKELRRIGDFTVGALN
jgi:hypothetical protein